MVHILSRLATLATGVTLGSWIFHKTSVTDLLNVKCNTVTTQPVPNDLELIHVQIFFRHGARTPLHLLSCENPGMVSIWDPNFFLNKSSMASQFFINHLDLSGGEVSDKPEGIEIYYQSKMLPGGSCIGQLTRQGQEQMFKLGMQLRKRYVDEFGFITPKYKPEEIYCRSTRIYRNIESTTCLLAGLFNLEQPLNKSYPLVYSSNFETENLVPNNHVCKILKELYKKGTIFLNRETDVNNTHEKLQNSLGTERIMCNLCNSEHNLHYYRDDLVAREYHGFYLPQNVKDILPELDKASVKEFLFHHFGGPPEENFSSIKYIAGNLIYMILSKISASKSNSTVEKFYLYATHDSMLIPLLVFLDIFDFKWPPYAADLRIELYRDKNTKEYWCQMMYCDQPKLPRFYSNERESSTSSYLFPVNVLEKRLKEYALDVKSYQKLCGYVEEFKKFTVDEAPTGM